jgi:iron complex outermembrane recepter protein
MMEARLDRADPLCVDSACLCRSVEGCVVPVAVLEVNLTWRSGVIAVVLMVSPRTVSAQAPGDPEPGQESAPVEAPPEAELAAAPEVEPTTELEVAVEPEVAEQPTLEPGEDEILVTGTRIRAKSSFAPSAPVEVIDRKQLERTGAKNLADVIQYLTGTQGTGTQGNTVVGVAGSTSSALNLRGLGVGATLVLLNGRRLNPAGAALGNAHFGDMSTIPLAAIERIEILKAGASAIYGADAVGGVVNLITRRNWDGVRVAADAQTTSRFDHHEYTATAGFGAVSEHGRVMVALSYFRRSELLVPKRYAAKDKYTGAFYPLNYTNLSTNERKPDPICMTSPDPEVCNQYYGAYLYLFPNTERPNAFASAEYDLGDHVTAFGELGVSRLRGDAIALPSFSVLTPVLTVPSDHVDNPFDGMPKLALSGAPLGDPYGANRQTSSDDSFRAVLGLRGDLSGLEDAGFLSEWEWEAYGSWGISRYREAIPDNLGDALQLALNSCSDPANLKNCFNPFYSAWDGTGTPNTREVIDRFRSRQVLVADHALQTFNVGFDGPVLELPGGPLALALGGEIRREWRVTEFDHDATQLRFGFLAGNTDSTAERYIYGAYLEARWPFIDGLELQTAGRLEQYTDTDEMALSPFAGLTLTPSEWFGSENSEGVFRRFQLRANASRAFRAPTVTNTYPGYGTLPVLLTYNDPITGMSQMTRAPVHYYGNPELTPETAVTLSAGVVWAPVKPLQVTFDYWYYNYQDRIQPQNAQRVVNEHQAAVAAGGMGTPDQVTFDPTTGVLLGVDSYAMNLEEPIVTSGFDFAVTFRVDGSDFGGGANDFGQFSLSAEGTYLIGYTVPRQEAGGPTALDCDSLDPQAPCEVSGKRNYYIDAVALPRLRANIPLVWTFAGHSLSAIGHFISGFLDDYREPGKAYVNFPAWISLDLQYGYTLTEVIGKRLDMRIGVQNVFDLMPPIARGPQTYLVGEVYDPRGRLLYASVGAEF